MNRNAFPTAAALTLAMALFSGCANEAGPEPAPAAPWPATPEALLDEWASAITDHAYDRYVALHEPGVVLERPDMGCVAPWQSTLWCLPWLAGGYWGASVGDEIPCITSDLDLDLQILREDSRDAGTSLLVRVAILYWIDRETNVSGLGELPIRFELGPSADGWRIARIVDESASPCS